MTPQKTHQSEKGHRINVILTPSQFERLKAYSEQEEISMSEAIRQLVKNIQLKSE